MTIEALRHRVRQFSRGAEWVSAGMFVGIFVLFVVSVFQRYVLAISQALRALMPSGPSGLRLPSAEQYDRLG